MDRDVDLSRIEDLLVEALEYLRQGRDLLGVPCHTALAGAEGYILNALQEVNRRQRDEMAKQPDGTVKQPDEGAGSKNPAA